MYAFNTRDQLIGIDALLITQICKVPAPYNTVRQVCKMFLSSGSVSTQIYCSTVLDGIKAVPSWRT